MGVMQVLKELFSCDSKKCDVCERYRSLDDISDLKLERSQFDEMVICQKCKDGIDALRSGSTLS